MAKMIELGKSIIAAHTDGHTRKYQWKGLRRHPVLKKRMTLYECDRNTFAEIVKECKDEDVLSMIDTSYSRTEGDCLEADAISIYVDSVRKEKFKKMSAVSGRHSASEIRLRNLNVCTIKIPLRNLQRHINELNKSSTSEIDKQ